MLLRVKQLFFAILALALAIGLCSFAFFNGGRDTAVSESDDFFFDAVQKPNYFLHVLGPFRFLSRDETLKLRRLRDEFGWAVDVVNFKAWTREETYDLCRYRADVGLYDGPTLITSPGTTYRDLMSLRDSHRDVMDAVSNVFPDICFDLPANSVELRYVPPRIDGRSVQPPSFIAAGVRDNTIESIKVRWEVSVVGREGVVAQGLFEETFVGGLAKGEILPLQNSDWNRFHASTIAALASRLGDIPLTMLACEQGYHPVNILERFRYNPDAEQVSCIDANNALSNLLLDLRIVVPELEMLLADPRLAISST